jgi:hypothetical protein
MLAIATPRNSPTIAIGDQLAVSDCANSAKPSGMLAHNPQISATRICVNDSITAMMTEKTSKNTIHPPLRLKIA